MYRSAILVAVVAVLGGCGALIGADFDHPTVVVGTDGGNGSNDPDSGVRGGEDGGVLGEAGPDTECPGADCLAPALVPSNKTAFGALPTSGATITVPAKASFDTTNACSAGSILGDCAAVIQPVGPAVCVCRAGSLVVSDLKVTGARGLALLVKDTVTIKGTLDIAATTTTAGAGAEPAPPTGGNGLFTHGNAQLVPLRGGIAALDGSAGGGALQISAGKLVHLEPNGVIQAGGGGGLGMVYAGRNAGSGGAILLEAEAVKLEGQLLANGGGGGGGGDRSVKGGDGQDARDAGQKQATGGVGQDGDGCSLNGYTNGGGGGLGAIEGAERSVGEPADSVTCLPAQYVEAGGTGGGVGRIRINAASASKIEKAASAFVSPKASTGTVTIE